MCKRAFNHYKQPELMYGLQITGFHPGKVQKVVKTLIRTICTAIHTEYTFLKLSALRLYTFDSDFDVNPVFYLTV